MIIAYFLGRFLGHKEIKKHRKDAVFRSRAILGGYFSEQLAPFLPNFKHSPTECKFLGNPIDFLVFKGMDKKKIEEIIFLEIKSRKSKLNNVEKSLKEVIKKGKIKWEEYKVDEKLTK